MSDETKLVLFGTTIAVLCIVGLTIWGYSARSQREEDSQCVYDNPKGVQYVKECSYKQSVCICIDNAVKIFGCEEKNE